MSQNETQRPSYAVVPPAYENRTSTSISTTSHPLHLGIHDSMRYGPRNLQHETSTSSAHPVQNRLEKWDETRDTLKLTMQKNMFGLGAPVRLLMERKIVGQNPHFPTGNMSNSISNLHMDILNGKDESLEPIDYLPTESTREVLDIHTHMEQKYRI